MWKLKEIFLIGTKKYLSIYDGIDFLEEHKHSYSNRWLTTLKINERKIGVAPNDIIKILSSENIESRPVWKPMHMQPFYKNNIFIKKELRTFLVHYLKKVFACLQVLIFL